MKQKSVDIGERMSKERWLTLGVFGLFAGLCNGLLGAGGGILAVFGLLRAYEGAILPRDVYANSLCVMVPLSMISAYRYAASGHLSFLEFRPYLIPAILGGIVGAILLGRMRNSSLSKLFGALVVWSGLMLILR